MPVDSTTVVAAVLNNIFGAACSSVAERAESRAAVNTVLGSIDMAYVQTASRLNVAREVFFSVINDVFTQIDVRADGSSEALSSCGEHAAVCDQVDRCVFSCTAGERILLRTPMYAKR